MAQELPYQRRKELPIFLMKLTGFSGTNLHLKTVFQLVIF